MKNIRLTLTTAEFILLKIRKARVEKRLDKSLTWKQYILLIEAGNSNARVRKGIALINAKAGEKVTVRLE